MCLNILFLQGTVTLHSSRSITLQSRSSWRRSRNESAG